MKILVTGATGYIGKRLTQSLLDVGHHVYALVRVKGTRIFPNPPPNLTELVGDLANPHTLEDLPQELDIAFFLVHSMSDIVDNLAKKEQLIAHHFIEKLKKTGVKQIIYLSGIMNPPVTSPHLQSRLRVEEELKKGNIPVTTLRASIIIGEGSAPFEIIRDLVEKLPLMIAPRWINNRFQPIAVRDVIFYLKAVMGNSSFFNQTFDIGGPNVLSFREAMLRFAHLRGLKRWILSVPVLTPRLSSYWLVLVTSVRFSLASYLVESMKSETICQNKIPLSHTCLSYEEALQQAFLAIGQNEVSSTWMDAWEIGGSYPSIEHYIQVPTYGILKDRKEVPLHVSPHIALERIWKIGGDTGWYTLNWAWKIRGLVDKLVGGVGLNRGRRHPSELQPGDSIDFWRVLKADQKDKHLILYAEMKLPGEAWLEFKLTDTHLIQQATFRPKGLLGRLYWYAVIPFHLIIFKQMAKKITEP